MSDNQLSSLYSFLSEKFDSIDARLDKMDIRFDAINRRFHENRLIQDEILNAIGGEFTSTRQVLNNHEKRLTKLEKRPA